jgi:proline iminopeptidase
LRPFINPEIFTKIEGFTLAGLLLLFSGVFLLTLLSLIILAFTKNRQDHLNRLGGRVFFVLFILALLAAIVLGSQWTAYTPSIIGADGKPLPGSIAVLEKVTLGGVEQWLIIRGYDINKPVLLFLSGGPGSSEAGRVLRFNGELEKHFVVVIWEQRGCGKSYPSLNPKSALTVDQYAADIVELAEILRSRFDEQKIYLVGHSWGTIIGTRAVQARLDLFHAYIGTAQMVNVLETDRMIYRKMLDYGQASGDTQYLSSLKVQGEPPYKGNNPIQPYANLLGKEYAIFEAPLTSNEAFHRDGDAIFLALKQPEYGWLDRLYYLLSLVDTFNVVYPQLQEFDFRRDAASLNVPVYLVAGSHDLNAPLQLMEDYFNRLTAPQKQMIYFEKSGHSMIWEEADKFHDLMVNTVLPETYKP